jgi:hypothetical protein
MRVMSTKAVGDERAGEGCVRQLCPPERNVSAVYAIV